MIKTGGYQKREEIRRQFWPDDNAWTGEKERGWFRAPRTLPLVLQLLRSKELSGKCDPGGVYLELLARHRDNGIVEMVHEGEHAYASGFVGNRGVRSWQERMVILEKTGFIKSVPGGNQRYKYVLLIHPAVVVHQLYDGKKVPRIWWQTYVARQIESKETRYEDIVKGEQKVVDITVGRRGEARTGA
jgi:hypothetical protein